MSDTTNPMVECATARGMTRWQILCSQLHRAWVLFRRRLPHLVWYGDELDVVVTLSQHKLQPTSDIGDAIGQLYSGSVFEVEEALSRLGIGFDRGIGQDGRDWEWDWSLKGPISIRFRSRARAPERRLDRRPRLVVDNGARAS